MSKCVNCGSEILTGDIHWEMGLCNNCYNELYKDHKTHISLDNMWLKLAQDFRDENEKLQDKVADLEAKLDESEKLTERLQQIIDKLRDKEFAGKALVEAVNAVYEPLYKNKYDEAKELKQQLAEKDQEIEELNDKLEWKSKWLKIADNMVGHYEKSNQDKISFAIEQLEKVKDIILNERKITSFNFDMFNKGKDTALFWSNEQIDNQIKSLKGEE